MKKGILLFLLVGLVLPILLVGCGQGNDVDNANVQTINITADEWGFSPNNVEVKTGKVKFVIENKGKVMHGFGIDELGINEKIGPGKTVEKVVNVDKPGTYTFKCTVVCGPLDKHNNMKGTLKAK